MNTTTVTNATEYRDLPLAMLTESTTNPRRLFEENALKELAETILEHHTAVHCERSGREPMEGLVQIEQFGAASGATRKLDSGLDGLGAGIAKECGIQMGRGNLDERFGQESA